MRNPLPKSLEIPHTEMAKNEIRPQNYFTTDIMSQMLSAFVALSLFVLTGISIFGLPFVQELSSS